MYTVGREGSPALTCQARPQEGEIFGEFPVRRNLADFTRYPVLIPSPTAAYNCTYEAAHLEAAAAAPFPGGIAGAAAVAANVGDARVRGFCAVLATYVAESVGAKVGDTAGTGGPERTVLFGLQRPPIGSTTILRCDAGATYDALAPTLLPFYASNARDAVAVSVDPANAAVLEALGGLDGLDVRVQAAAAFAADAADAYNVVETHRLADNNNTNGETGVFPMVQQFLSLYFPMGHVKSTTTNDAAFLEAFAASPKWLAAR